MCWKRFAAILAWIGMTHLLLVDFAIGGDAPRWHPISVESFARNIGPGAEVEVKLTSGEKIAGPISEIAERAFMVDVGEGERFEVRYTRVEDMTLTRRSFDENEPDPLAVRRVVIALGSDAHVMVRTVADEELRGHIGQIQDASFQLILDGQDVPTDIEYDGVLQIGKNLSTGATIVIVVGIVMAAVVIVAIATSDDIADALGR